MTREARVSEGTIRKIIKDDLKAKSRGRTRYHLITDLIKASRLQRSKNLLNILKDRKKPKILFSDEKLFNLDFVHNIRNKCYISPKKGENVPKNIKHTF